MRPWEHIDETRAADGSVVELLRRGHEYLIRVAGYDLMSSEDAVSASALGQLGCAHIDRSWPARVMVGGLGMGYTLRAALDATGADATVEVVELIDGIVAWNRGELAALSRFGLDDPRVEVAVEDVASRLCTGRSRYDAILLDVDNGPDALAHESNQTLYETDGLERAWGALRPGGVLAVWSFSDDRRFTKRLEAVGFAVSVHRVSASRKGRGRRHVVWTARRPAAPR